MKFNIITKEKLISYQVLFSVGIVILGSGAVFLIPDNGGVGAGLMIPGGSFMIIGGKNRDYWKNNK